MTAEGAVRSIIEAIGDDPDREGLRETPARVRRSWEKLYGGYKQSAGDILQTVFTEGACNEMVVLRDCEFYSTCEHHMLPFFGSAHIGYIPNGAVVGVSKLARLVEVYSRRLQIQEQLTTQVADAIEAHLKAKGVMVILEAQHFCMTSRGVEKQHSKMVTSAIRGVFEKSDTRNEFMRLIGK
jgi:GTP cyclohydrolase I